MKYLPSYHSWCIYMVMLLCVQLAWGNDQHARAGIGESMTSGAPDSLADSTYAREWHLVVDLSSPAVIFLGGGRGEYFGTALGLKRVVNNMGFRFMGTLYPHSRYSSMFFPQSRLMEVSDDGQEGRYLATHEYADMLRASMGAEWRRVYERHALYVGADFNVSAERVEIGAGSYWRGFEEEPIEYGAKREQSMDYFNFVSTGVGLAPFVGFEYRPWSRFGFNLELRADVNNFNEPAYHIDEVTGNVVRDNAKINYFRTFPLLVVRTHFRF